MFGSAIQPRVPYLGRSSVSPCFQKDCSVPKSNETLANELAGGFRRFGQAMASSS